MAWYPYSYKTAFDPSTRELAPKGSVGQVFAVGDSGFTSPLPTYDLNGLPVELEVSGEAGYVPSFQVEDHASVVWKSGDYVFEFVTTKPIPGPQGEPGKDGKDGSNVIPTAEAVEYEVTTAGQPAAEGLKERFAAGMNIKVAADGTDDKAALDEQFSAAASFGVPAHLPAGVVISVGAKIDLPTGLRLHTNGAAFQGLSENGAVVVNIVSDTHIVGGLTVRAALGTNVRGVSVEGANVTIDTLDVSAPSPGAGAGDSYDSGLSIANSSDVKIGSLSVTNFDYAVSLADSARIRVGVLRISTYVRGLYITDTPDVSVEWGLIEGASPNAIVTPGHCGVLMNSRSHDATHNVRLNHVTVKDSGEHGYRIGGSFRVKRVWFNQCAAINTGACGFKVLGGTTTDNNHHEDIFFPSCLVEDAGQADLNAAAFMLQYVRNVKVTDPIVRRNNKTYSAGHGFEIQAAEYVTVLNPTVMDTKIAAYAVRHVLANCTNVRLIGGLLNSASGDGVFIEYTDRTFRRVSVESFPQIDIAGTGHSVRIINNGGGAVAGGNPWITWHSAASSARQIGPDSLLTGWFCDARAQFEGDPAFKDGSTWTDSSTGVRRVRDAGVWKTPTLA